MIYWDYLIKSVLNVEIESEINLFLCPAKRIATWHPPCRAHMIHPKGLPRHVSIVTIKSRPIRARLIPNPIKIHPNL